MLISEYPVVSVHIPPMLRPLAGGRDEIMASGETVGEVLEAVGHEYLALGESLFCADGSLADGLAVYFGGAVLHGRESLTMPVGQEEVVSIVAVANPSCPTGLVRTATTGRTATGDEDEAVISVGN
jgi:molybdopterin converting factor small subunit